MVTRTASLKGSAALVRARLHAALYNAREQRLGRLTVDDPGLPPLEPIDPAETSIYFDETDASLGTVTSLTTRGTFASTFVQATTTYAAAVMQADGLLVSGNVLRWNGSQGPFSKITVLIDITRTDAPHTSAGVIFNINPNASDHSQRCWIRYTATNYQLVGPNNVTINFAPIGGYGDRQIIGAEFNIAAGTMTAIEADGLTQEAAITGPSVTVTRIDMAQSSRVKIHELIMIAEV